ncbi:class I SAM-dependent methyltransferase [Aquicella lusitana]|nr:class I SAM-dependent methyltransferase [Aquicella lusitana]
MIDTEAIETFDKFADEYDTWFDRHPAVFQSELAAFKKLIPESGDGLEIGVGSGRFASRRGIKTGVEPSDKLGEMAKIRGIDIHKCTAETLPFKDQQFDFILLSTVLCYVRVPLMALQEVKRVLKTNGILVIGMIDRKSFLGQIYEIKKQENKFYQHAHFYSAAEILDLLHEINFEEEVYQTIFSPIENISTPEPIKPDYGEGGFIVISAKLAKKFFYPSI